MTTTKRPPSARKPSRTVEKKAAESLEMGLKVTIDGETHEVRLGDITSAVSREYRAISGRGVTSLLNLLPEDPDVDLVADFVWLARRLRGEVVAHEDVEVSYSDILAEGFDFDVIDKRDAGDDGGPEA